MCNSNLFDHNEFLRGTISNEQKSAWPYLISEYESPLPDAFAA
jgi:hypothetical protein